MQEKATSVDAYIAGFPPPVRGLLDSMRATIRKAAPEAGEKISYGVPTFTLHGNLVHFAGYARHIGFYPGPSAIAAFESELTRYKRAKGTVQFPLSEPLPLETISRMVAFLVERQMRKAESKKTKSP